MIRRQSTIGLAVVMFVGIAGLSACSAGSPMTVTAEGSCVNWTLDQLLQEYRVQNYTIFLGTLAPTGPTKQVARSDAQTVFTEMKPTVTKIVTGPPLNPGDSVWVEGGTNGDLTVVTDQWVSAGGGSGYFAIRTVGDVGQVADDWYPVANGQVLLDGVCHQPGTISARPLSGATQLGVAFNGAAAAKSASAVLISSSDFEATAQG